ncbi:MAG TPA: hypothetical protein VHZ24_15595 [Pirellulales bacterium]|nr:hypothetical protein [Pirellulales bacterium]
MAAALVEIADAVVAALSAATYSQPISACRKYLANYEIKDLEPAVVVTVIPRNSTSTPATRTACQYDHTIDLAVQNKISGSDEDLDALVNLVDEIEKSLRLQTLTTISGRQAKWAGTTSEAAYDLKHLEEKRVFTSVLTLSYRTVE